MTIDALINKTPKLDIRVYAVLISLIFSAIAPIFNPIFNHDAVFYFRIAENFLQGNIEGDNPYLFTQPLIFSRLLAVISSVLSTDLPTSANILNALLTALLVFSFISVVKAFSNKASILFFAALSILLLPSLNEYRHYVIRDLGFCSFMMTSLLCLIYFIRHHDQPKGRLVGIILWPLCCFCATTFRAEGLTLFIVPIGYLFSKDRAFRTSLNMIGMLYILPIIIGFILYTASQTANTNIAHTLTLTQTLALQNEINFLDDKSLLKLSDLEIAVKEDLLIHLSRQFTTDVIAITFIYIVFIKIVTSLSAVFSAIWSFGVYRKLRIIPQDIKGVYVTACLVLLGVLLASVLKYQFMSGRQTLSLALLLLVMLPLIVEDIYQKMIQLNKTTRFIQVATTIALLLFIDGFITFGHRKNHIVDGIEWLQNNLEKDHRLLTNNSPTAYLAGAEVNWINVRHYPDKAYYESFWKLSDHPKSYDYIALISKEHEFKKEKEYYEENLERVMTFKNNRNDTFTIYKISEEIKLNGITEES